MVKHPTIYHSGEYILMNGDMAERDNLFIEWGQYGGDTYSICICFKKTRTVFGNTKWEGMKTLQEVNQMIKFIRNNSCINTVRKWDRL